MRIVTCSECTASFYGRPDRLFCSSTCRNRATRRRRLVQIERQRAAWRFSRAAFRAGPTPVSARWAAVFRNTETHVDGRWLELFRKAWERSCECCSKPFTTTHSLRRFCSDRCNRKIRKGKAQRQAKKNGAEARYFNVKRIFDRDGWKCRLCGTKTPKHLRGTYAPNAPELDHIVPLAMGGSHTQENVQCACRTCNGLKSTKPLGQLWLTGIADTRMAETHTA